MSVHLDTTASRREFLCRAVGLLGFAGASQAGAVRTCNADRNSSPGDSITDVPWLAEVQRPPAESSAFGKLPSLLRRSDGTSIETLAEWKVERERLRQRWLDFLGPMPAERPPLKLTVLREERLGHGCTRQLVRYASEADELVEGYLLRPKPDQAIDRRAGIVALHPTTDDHIHEIAGVRGRPGRDLGVQLARRGFVVFCPQCFLWRNGNDYVEAVKQFKQRRPQTLGMQKMLWDAMRGVDVLTSLTDEVDADRIGATGHSLGGKEALYLCAFDERVRAIAASEFGIGLTFTNWDAPWYLGSAIHEKEFSLNHHELLALAAPRPFLILAGESGPGAADGDRSWPYVEAAMPVYRLYGGTPRIGLYNHREGHTLSAASLEKLAEWLTNYLAVNT
jgi:hypothetical protein